MTVNYQKNMVAEQDTIVRKIDYTKKLPDAEYDLAGRAPFEYSVFDGTGRT